jgi:tRNA threonylcarbamoyladenosine biosynthesis protein TsaB
LAVDSPYLTRVFRLDRQSETFMRILAIETSGRFGSVAALSGDAGNAQILREIVLSEDQRTAQRLAPAMLELLAAVEWSPQDVQIVSVTVGPGSFTGLRIGVTAAKTFAYAVGAEVIGINTLVVLAVQAAARSRLEASLWTVMDAQRRELFVASFDGGAVNDVATNCDVAIVHQDAWLAKLRPKTLVIGPVLKRLKSQLPDGVVAVDEALWQPKAATVGKLAWQAYLSGYRDDVWKLSPRYYRMSAAEEKRPI